VLIELLSLGVTAEALLAKIDRKSAISLQRGPVDPKFQVEWVAPSNHSSSRKTRVNDLSYGIKIYRDLSSVLSQSNRLTDRLTDRIPIARPRLHFVQCSKNGQFKFSTLSHWQPMKLPQNKRGLPVIRCAAALRTPHLFSRCFISFVGAK